MMGLNFCLQNLILEFKCSIRLALPLVASEIIYALNNFVAIIIVAHLGKEQLAANTLVWSIYLAVIVFVIGTMGSIGTMISQYFGAKNDRYIGICFNQGIIIAVAFSLPMISFCLTKVCLAA